MNLPKPSPKDLLIVRDSENTEYEIKLECLDKNKELVDFLRMVEAVLKANELYIVDPVQTTSEMTSHFLVDTDNEYSVFRYNGEVMLKIKKHDIIKGRELPIFKNSEHFVYDLAEITAKLQDSRIAYVGSMLKRRIKDFIIDSEDGRVYSLAITICQTGDQKQHQLEVEYYGYLKDRLIPDPQDEGALLSKLVTLCAYIQKSCPGEFIPSVERKYEFVFKHGAVTQAEADERKTHLLKHLEKI